MPVGVWVLGGFQSDFARNWSREGLDIADLFAEAVPAALDDAGVAPANIGVIHVGNAFGQLFTGQGHLGAMPATVVPELAGVPGSRHEAACASGGVALLAAMADLEAGRYETALVVGAELEKTVDGATAAELMAAAGWVGHEAQGERFVWPWAFDRIAGEYADRYGLDEEHLRAIGALNRRNARSQPAGTDPHLARRTRHLRRRRRGQPAGGGPDPALGLLADHRRRRGRRAGHRSLPGAPRHRPRRAGASRLAGWGHRSSQLPLEPKLQASRESAYVLPHVRTAILEAQSRAGIAGVEQIDLIETHDCFTPSQYLAIDHFGITKPGASWQAIESGDLERDGRIPMNPSGGLIGVGHPVGATGVRMVLDAHRQVTGTAGECQVTDARTAATLNIGGSTATAVTFIVAAPPH